MHIRCGFTVTTVFFNRLLGFLDTDLSNDWLLSDAHCCMRWRYYPRQADLFKSDHRFQSGDLALSYAPGWGIEVNSEWLALSYYQVRYAALRF